MRSNGRFILGVGTGWNKDEFKLLNVDFASRGGNLLIGGHASYLGHLAQQVDSGRIALHIAASPDDVKRIFEQEAIDIVFLGRASFPEERLRILEYILRTDRNPSIHLMCAGADPVRFVGGILKGLAD